MTGHIYIPSMRAKVAKSYADEEDSANLVHPLYAPLVHSLRISTTNPNTYRMEMLICLQYCFLCQGSLNNIARSFMHSHDSFTHEQNDHLYWDWIQQRYKTFFTDFYFSNRSFTKQSNESLFMLQELNSELSLLNLHSSFLLFELLELCELNF